jgi:hypothetical protein
MRVMYPDHQRSDLMSKMHYYVSVRDAGRTGLLLGPYGSESEARGHVERARKMAEQSDPFAHFYSFGTAGAPFRRQTVFGS